MSTQIGGLLPSDLLLVFDGPAKQLQAAYATLGLGSPTESGTMALAGQTARQKTMGDGTATFPGLANAAFQRVLSPRIDTAVKNSGWDRLFNTLWGPYWIDVDNSIRQSLPPSWSFSDSSKRVTDQHLLRYNATHPSTPTAPSWTPTLTATTGGSIPTGSGRRVKVSLVGSFDYLESTPSAGTSQVALSGPNNAYVLGNLGGGSGNVPAGVTKLRIYAQTTGAAGGDPYYWSKDVPVTAGAAWSGYVITITASDADLRQDWQPPSYASCLMTPESATLYALSYASENVYGVYGLSSIALLSEANVALNPASGFAGGLQNQPSMSTLASWSAGATTFGSVRNQNDYTKGLQGFLGAANDVQFRVTSALNASAAISSITYSYVDSTHPTATSATIAGPLTLTATLGSTVAMGVPAGRIVTAITAMTVGTATSGSLVAEAKSVRVL